MPTNAELTEQQKQQWTAVAEGWERWTDWLENSARDLTDWLGDRAGAQPGSRLLDLACGGGEPAATLAARVAPGGDVVAADISPEMVGVTRRRAERLGRTNLTAQVADLQSLPFDDASFDAVTCRFGLMFCPEPELAAREIRRVLRPGGRLAAAVWDLPAKNPFFIVLAEVLGRHMELPPPDPKAPGIFRLAPPGEFEGILRGAGLEDVLVESRPMIWAYDSPEEYWKIQIDLAAPLRAAIRTLPAESVDRLREDVLESLHPFTENGQVRLTATALCGTGRNG